IQTELRRRRRHARVVRLEVDPGMSREVLELLMRELELQPSDVYQLDGLLDMGSLLVLTQLDRPDLKAEVWTPTTQPRLRGVAAEVPDLFAVLRAGDILAHHPYDSFATSVEALIDHAAGDSDVLAIKQTLYRTSGPASPIVRALIRAAERGKQVVALVEIKARGGDHAAHRAGGRSRRPHHHQGQQPDRPGDHRRPLLSFAARRADRPARPLDVLAEARRAGSFGTDPGALDRRPVPRALPRVCLR